MRGFEEICQAQSKAKCSDGVPPLDLAQSPVSPDMEWEFIKFLKSLFPRVEPG